MARICSYEAFARITGQRVGSGFDRTRIAVHAVQKQIHHAQASRIGNQFPAADKARLQMPLLVLVHVVVLDHEVESFQQETAGTACWIADGIIGSWLDAIDDRFDQFARREVLPGSFGAFFGTLFEQTFVDIPIGISLHAGPVLGVDQLDDQASERGGILDILPRLLEDRPEHPGLLSQFIENLAVVFFEFFTVALKQAGPIEAFGHSDLFVVRRLRLFVGHFQKEQKRDLLGVGHVGKPIIAQDMGKVPSFVDDLFCVRHVVISGFFRSKFN